jgi:hypothetical protein
MRRVLYTAIAMATVLQLTVVGAGQPASGRETALTRRFAPSGTVSMGPTDRPSRLPSGVRAPVPSPVGTSGCPDASATNVRANQECTNQSGPGLLGRGQSQNETAVAVNPTNPANILIGQNDYREGDSGCGVDWTLDGGEHWGSQILPSSFTAPGLEAARHYWDANGDPVVAFDSSGAAYYSCLMFDRGVVADNGDNASAIVVFRSVDGGASWSFDADIVAITPGDGSDGVGLHDKEWMAIDTNKKSPYRDRIYVVWNKYNTDFTADPPTFAYSDDHGVTWHQSGEIGGFSEELCPINFDGSPSGTCNTSGFPMIFIGQDAAVYVVFMNYNNCAGALRMFGYDCPGRETDNHNQVLIVKSTDGGNSFGPPTMVADFHELPDCLTYTGENAFRACVPTAPLSDVSIFRAAEYPSGVALDPDTLVVNFGSYINRHSSPAVGNCFPAGLSPETGLNRYDGVGVPGGCNNDIVRSVSHDGGATWSGGAIPDHLLPSVNGEVPGRVTDQWWQWSDRTLSGKVVVAYYDRQYGTCQADGCMDITMAVRDVGPGHATFTRVTDASMPPGNDFPGTSGYSTFFGDYIGLAVGSDGIAHPVWADNRNPQYTFDPEADARDLIFAGYGADIYTASIPVA